MPKPHATPQHQSPHHPAHKAAHHQGRTAKHPAAPPRWRRWWRQLNFAAHLSAVRFLYLYGIIIVALLARPLTDLPGTDRSLPTGYRLTPVATGLYFPTNLAWLPDGTMLISEKRGTIRVFRGGALQDKPLLDLSSTTNDYYDRGLISLTPDPDFAHNHYLYLMRVLETNKADYEGTKVGQLLRFTLNASDTSVVPGSQKVVLGTQTPISCDDIPVNSDCLPADSAIHSVGDLAFAPDGTIFASSGDGAVSAEIDMRALRSQNIDSLAGKILHVDKEGRGLPTNPFYTGNPNDNRSKIWALGQRNPWRLTLKPGTSLPYAVDVGSDFWEEINEAKPGSNFGWPCFEGNDPQPSYSTLDECKSVIADATSGLHPVTKPLVTWSHDGQDSAAVGGSFVTANRYPDKLLGSYLYSDYAKHFLRSIRTDAAGKLSSGPLTIATKLPSMVNLKSDPAGAVYFVNISDDTFQPGTGQILRLDYDPSEPSTIPHAKPPVANPNNLPPQVTITSPASSSTVNIGDTVSFSGQATDIEDGLIRPSDLIWNAVIQHCVGGSCHAHFLEQFKGLSGQFTFPDHGTGTYYIDLSLTATDAAGAQSTRTVRINPNR